MSAIADCKTESLPLKFEIEYKPMRLSCQLPEDFSVDRKTYFTSKFGERWGSHIGMIQNMGKSMGLEMYVPLQYLDYGVMLTQDDLRSVADGRLSQTTRAHRLAMKAYAIGGEETQQALIRLYFEAYFNEGKDIGDVDLLGDLAEKVGFMTKDEVRSPLLTYLTKRMLIMRVV